LLRGIPTHSKASPIPFQEFLKNWSGQQFNKKARSESASPNSPTQPGRIWIGRCQPLATRRRTLTRRSGPGTTSIQAADANGWVVSVTPSGGWLPAYVAGNTGIGMSQRMQSFVLDPAENPFNVVAPGKRPRVTLTPTLALKSGKPFLCFSVQGGDTQDQNLLQFFLNVVEFGMTVQEACEAANITSYQMRSSFGKHDSQPGRVTLNEEVPSWVRRELRRMDYTLDFARKPQAPSPPSISTGSMAPSGVAPATMEKITASHL
jgi:gamma-glutamyltranspeptidase